MGKCMINEKFLIILFKEEESSKMGFVNTDSTVEAGEIMAGP